MPIFFCAVLKVKTNKHQTKEMETKILLSGKWLFVAMENFAAGEWQKNEKYVGNMTWSFDADFIKGDTTLGTITERNERGSETQLSYAYDAASQQLRIETDPIPTAGSEQDIYEVCSLSINTITISIQNEHGCPPPYLRYTLRKIE